ncbi:MAG: FtsX-like permease family protein [Phycisphaerae bacterium]|nr:FtsX-like permease family protein [Phycisphaerae bacterium]
MYKLMLATRYFLKRRISVLAIAAIALCVFIVVVVMSVMVGLVNDFKNKNHDYSGDCVIHSQSMVGFAYYEDFVSELEEQDFIRGVSPVIDGFGLLRRPNTDDNIGIQIRGVDPVKHSEATGFGETLYFHKDNPKDAFVSLINPNLPGSVIGISIIYQSDSNGEYNHYTTPPVEEFEITCFPLNAKGGLAKAGADITNSKAFAYSDDTHSGLVKVDGGMIYLPFAETQEMFEMGGQIKRINSIRIKFAKGVSVDKGTARVAAMWKKYVERNKDETYANLFDNVSVEDWFRYRREIIAGMQKEQTMLTILFSMLGVITVFVIFVVFYMIIGHKTRDIGIMKSIGVSSWSVVSIFLLFAGMVGIVGSAIGATAGCAVLYNMNEIEAWVFKVFHWQPWNRAVYAIGEIPHDIEPDVIAVIVLCAIGASLLGAFMPAVQAGFKRPVEVLQVNQV